MVDILLTLAAAALILESDVRRATVAYVVLTLTTLRIALPHVEGTADTALFATIAFLKVAVGPAMVLTLVARYHARSEMGSSFGPAVRLLVAFGAIAAGHAAARMDAFSTIPHAAAVFEALLASAAVVILNRSLLAHALGLLALGSAIGLASTVFAAGLPLGVELGDTFDGVLATFVALAIVRAAIVHDPSLDVRSMRSLRG